MSIKNRTYTHGKFLPNDIMECVYTNYIDFNFKYYYRNKYLPEIMQID